LRCERRTTRESDGIAFGPVVDLSDVMFRMLEPSEVAAAMDFPSVLDIHKLALPDRFLTDTSDAARETATGHPCSCNNY
jgi:hypothetical protein